MSGNTPNSTTPTNNISLSSNEAAVYAKLFQLADVSGKGAVSPSEAVTFLSKSKLPQEILGKVCPLMFECFKDSIYEQIWSLADSEGRGTLSQASFYKALKWIAIAQSGKAPSLDNLNSSKCLCVCLE